MSEIAVVLAESAALIARSAELCTAFRRHIAGGADRETSLVVEALVKDSACLACLVSTTGLPETTVTGSLRRLRGGLTITVGPCSRCGGEHRLLCGLASD
jgi:hypothetical protein